MKAPIFKPLLLIAIFSGIFSGCVDDDDYAIPTLECIDPNIAINKSVYQIHNQATFTAIQYTANDFIEAYVISSDKGGNFFKTLQLQAIDNSIGFAALTDYPHLATLYAPGKKVIIKMQGLYTQIKNGGLLIGSLNTNNVGRISQFDTPKIILRDCNKPINEELLVQHITIIEALSSNTYLNKLIEFDKVQFKDDAVGKPYFLGGANNNRSLVDTYGNEIIVKSTYFTKFKSNIIPEQSGKVRGILTRFGTIYSFIPRFESDIQLTEPRFNINTDLRRTNIQYRDHFTENF